MATEANHTNSSFRFQGTYSEADLDAMAVFVVSLALDKRIGRNTLLAAGVVGILSLLFRSWLFAIGGLLVVIGVSLLVRYVFLPRRLLRHARQLPGPVGQRIITIDENEIRHSGQGADVVHAKAAIRRAVLTRDHLFLLFHPQGLLMVPLAWIRPVAAIEDVALLLAQKPHV